MARVRAGIRPLFLAALLQSPAYRNWLSGHARGTTVRSLSTRVLRTLRIPVPPEPVQDAVIAELRASPRADALAVLSRLLSGATSNSVAVWLETPVVAQLAAGTSADVPDGMKLLVDAARGLRSLVIPAAVEPTLPAADDRAIRAWLEPARRAASALGRRCLDCCRLGTPGNSRNRLGAVPRGPRRTRRDAGAYRRAPAFVHPARW